MHTSVQMQQRVQRRQKPIVRRAHEHVPSAWTFRHARPSLSAAITSAATVFMSASLLLSFSWDPDVKEAVVYFS